ncbi:ArsR family transcriptional regulator [Phytohabitans flavus]|uniref:ArsR family transcriptional regulator n=1 Tax=Phytohabitans flavus TaxID=1076124 RepID=A0A6F8XPL4_9ACTN|nr:ArsR family transcriptional regulator [Phytohabitans flavus]BCB75750.1 ArsR family transcriptional regulator [Phytohabitans flavus]
MGELDAAPPAFLGLAGHPVRWRLLTALARSDRQVHELTALVGEPQNLVSYHLGRLRAAGLVFVRRSAADGRVGFYALDLARCGDLLAAAGAALHPALALVPPPLAGFAPPGAVLFLCTGNSARSQMAEVLLQRARPELTVASAGSHPKPLHPDAVRVMAERGIDMSERRSKHLGEFTGDRFGHVVTLCDRVRLVAPDFPGEPERVHWSIPDPARAGDGLAAFVRTADELSTRIHYLLHRIMPTSTVED